MTSNAPFKICIIASICAHLALFCSWPLFRSISRPEIRFQKIELTYFRDGPVEDVVIKDIKPITSVRRDNRLIEAAKKEAVKSSEDKTPEASTPLEAEAYREVKVDLKDELHSEEGYPKEVEAQSRLLREAYYMKVREKIKSTLEKNCKGRLKEGEVYVKFTIKKDGALKDLVLYKSSGRNPRLLEAMAIQSIKEASPFPPFDEEMAEIELLFRQPIQITYHR